MPEPPFTKTPCSPFIELQSVDSTNNYARQLIEQARLPDRQEADLHGTTVFAHEQIAGKGQRGKVWASEKDMNIALSMLIKPQPLLVTQQFQLSACAAVAAHEFFMKYAGDESKIKWPNDIYWQD
ncbi:MAG: biotin--[acetyl-CoA-carboxylase] ligase, partial [Bacteroidota bacterium]